MYDALFFSTGRFLLHWGPNIVLLCRSPELVGLGLVSVPSRGT
jgi:hypothetical protein